MNLVLALRESNSSRLSQRLAELGLSLVRSRYEAMEPALRNLIDGLFGRGLVPEREGLGLCWCLVESDRDPAFWLGQPGVAVCFDQRWLQQQSLQIRYLKGIAYCDAAAAWAALLPFEDRAAEQSQPAGLDWQGQTVVGPELSGDKRRALRRADPEPLDEEDDGDDPFNRLPGIDGQVGSRARSESHDRSERSDRRDRSVRGDKGEGGERARRDFQAKRSGKPQQARSGKGQSEGGKAEARGKSGQDGRKQRTPRPALAETGAVPAERQPVLLKRRGRPAKALDTAQTKPAAGIDAATDEEQMDMFV